MEVYNVRNVNHAFPLEVNDILKFGKPSGSRAGNVLEFPYPVATTYLNPRERVLFDTNRLCNPFFHFMEGLWIINGSDDVAFLDLFNTQMKQYSDDGKTFHGAYGHRLRHKFGFDQIELAVQKLREDHTDRRVVLQMWDPSSDLRGGMKDHPCNTNIYLKIRDGYLMMTVCCRSNDLLYGALGANVVHMSMLQEYLAGRIGVTIGSYTQVSDSMHVYTDSPVWKAVKYSTPQRPDDPYERGEVKFYPMFTAGYSTGWWLDLKKFMHDPFSTIDYYRTNFFEDVVRPIALAWHAHKKFGNGLIMVDSIGASDWRFACKNWLQIKEDDDD